MHVCIVLLRQCCLSVCPPVIAYHIVELKRQNSLKVGTDKDRPKLKVNMQSVSDDDVQRIVLGGERCTHTQGVIGQKPGKHGYRRLIA